MESKLAFIVLLTSFTIGCAVPNYQNSDVEPNTLGSLCFANITQCLNVEWEAQPSDSKMNSFFIQFFLPASPEVFAEPAYKVDVILWMPSMGHGSLPVTVEKFATGVYKASRVYFIMPGEWEIRIQMKDGTGNVIDQIIKNIII